MFRFFISVSLTFANCRGTQEIDSLSQKSNHSLKDAYEGKYSDYTLSLFRPVAVLEAKKTGNYFELPIGKNKLVQPLKSLYKDNPNIKKAINQVKFYCHERSIQIAIISNGWQIIAFIANRHDSIPVLNGNALIISSLDNFLDNFKEVWNCLSKSGFENEYLFKGCKNEKEGMKLINFGFRKLTKEKKYIWIIKFIIEK